MRTRLYVVAYHGGNRATWECAQGCRWQAALADRRRGQARFMDETALERTASWWSREKGGVDGDCPRCAEREADNAWIERWRITLQRGSQRYLTRREVRARLLKHLRRLAPDLSWRRAFVDRWLESGISGHAGEVVASLCRRAFLDAAAELGSKAFSDGPLG